MSPWRSNDGDELMDDYATPRRSGPGDLLGRLSGSNTMLADPSDPDAPPSRMQRPEDQVGYGVAVAIVVIGIIFALVHGKGSPKHPHTSIEIIGVIVAALTPLAIFRYANRFVSAIMVVLASLLISIVRPPDKWIGLYYVMLVGSLGYAFWLTRHQSKAARLQTVNRRTETTGRNRTQSASTAARGKRRKGEEQIVPTRNRRYTPPQAPRERPKRSEVAAAPVPTTSRRKRRQEASKDSKAR
jgi:hypothetical protein